MGMGKAGQTFGVVACVGGLVWAGFALGQVKGKREGRSEVEARWAQARSLALVDQRPAPPPSQVAAALASLGGTCVDTGESPLGAPHFCRWGDEGGVATAVHWWGPIENPTRAYVAFFPGDNAPPAATTVDIMRFSAITLATRFSPPEGFWARIVPTDPEASFRSGDVSVTVREHRIIPSLPPMMLMVDLTSSR